MNNVLTIRFTIKEKHIDAGRPRDPFNCPLCLALADAGYPGAVVRGADVSVPWEGKLYEGPLPSDASLVARIVDEQRWDALALVRARLPMEVEVVLEEREGIKT